MSDLTLNYERNEVKWWEIHAELSRKPNLQIPLEGYKIKREKILRWMLKEYRMWMWHEVSGWGQGPKAWLWQHGNEHSGPEIKHDLFTSCVTISLSRSTRGADKSLARSGRKQATATKLGIYPTYSPWSSIHFLARCSNFCKPLKKFRRLSTQPGLRGSNDLCVGRKMATFQLFFQSREQVAARRGHIRRIGWVIKTLEADVGQFLLGCKCSVSRGSVVQE